MEPGRLIGQPVHTDDRRGRHVRRLEERAPLRDPLTVTGEDDGLRRIWRHVHRHLPTSVVLERLGDELLLRSGRREPVPAVVRDRVRPRGRGHPCLTSLLGSRPDRAS